MKVSDKATRRSEHLPLASDENFLTDLNQRLTETPDAGARCQYPIIFIAGAPRGGTTISAQAMCRYFNVAYVNNLVAKFWLAPATGMRLSRLTFGTRQHVSSSSRYGRTSGQDIHSFHYFWMRHLKLGESADLFTNPDARGVDWAAINGHLAAMEAAAGTPLLFKGYYPAYFMAAFARHVRNCIFILVRREPLAQALSIHEARLSIMGDARKWWSLQPPEIERLLPLSPEAQVAGQVLGLNKFYDQQIAAGHGRLQ